MKKTRWWLLGLVLTWLVAWGVASSDRCGAWPLEPAKLTQLAQGEGLSVGAAKVDFALSLPMTVGGYGPLRSTAAALATPLCARAVVLDGAGQKLGLVVLDALLVPPQLRDAIGEGQPFPVWVVASHTHSGPSGFDPRPAAELAALGAYSRSDEAALVTAARAAVEQAASQLVPVTLATGERATDGVSVARTGENVDRRLDVVAFRAGEKTVAQFIIASAHPALVKERTEVLDADWPGRLATLLEADDGPVTLVMQGAAGNASVDRRHFSEPQALAEALARDVRALPLTSDPSGLLALNEVQVSLPRPDASHLVPALLRPAVENVLCENAEDFAVLHGLQLGQTRLLFVPGEPTDEAGLLLESQARAHRLVSLADGYVGYVETEANARAGRGETFRSYFPASLLGRLAEGAKLAGDATGKRD